MHFLLEQKYDDFLVITPLLHGPIRHILSPTTFSSAGVHLTKFSPIFASFQQKCLEKIFVALGGASAPPGYAYEYHSVYLSRAVGIIPAVT